MRFSWPNRSVPAAVENCAFQRASGVEEQGRGEVFRQVLSCGGEQPVGRFDDGGRRIWYYCFLMCYDCLKMTLHPCDDENCCFVCRKRMIVYNENGDLLICTSEDVCETPRERMELV